MGYGTPGPGFLTGGASPSDQKVTTLKAGANVTLTNADNVCTIASTGGGGGGNTLDQAYDQGGAGLGNTVTADSGAVTVTVPDTSNNAGVVINQNDTTNNPNALEIAVSAANKLTVTTAGILNMAGPPQSDLAANAGDPNATAVDLQFVRALSSQVAGSAQSGLFAGQNNTIGDNATQSVILGSLGSNITGNNATQTADECAIIGGDGNTITSTATVVTDDAAIIGGATNTINGASASGIFAADGSTCSGGTANSGVIGGSVNGVTGAGANSVVVGGSTNTISSTGANNVILGGMTNVLGTSAANSVAMGTGAVANALDDSVLYIGGPGGGPSATNALALVGVNYAPIPMSAGNGYADVAWVGGGADFAEYFEWDDGNSNSEDRVGYFVALSTGTDNLPNGNIEISGTNVIGAVSALPGLIANAAAMNWQGRYQRDIWGRYSLDSNGDRIENSNFNSNQSYSPRPARSEWDAIAMKGRVRVRASTNLGVYPSSKSGMTVDIDANGEVKDAGNKGRYKVIKIHRQKEIWSGPQGIFRNRTLIQDHGYGIVEVLID